jgi:xanthine dehydrogenase molybdenum-binding subunit
VDTWTGIVKMVKAISGGDCGTVVNPDMAAGQLEGGLSRGTGFAIYENNNWNTDGQLSSKGFWIDAKTPGIMESPYLKDFQTHFANTTEPSGPLGAKGLGEASSNPVAAALASSIYNAIGIRFSELPITPEMILQAIYEKEGQLNHQKVLEVM